MPTNAQSKKRLLAFFGAEEGISKNEFLQAFEDAVKQILRLEKELLDRNNEKFTDLQGVINALKQDNSGEFKQVRDEIAKALSNALESLKKRADELNTRLQAMRDSKEADDERVINETLGRIKFPEMEKVMFPTPQEHRDMLEGLPDGEKLSIQAIQDLSKALEELERKIISKKGSSASLISKRIRFIDDETPTGTVDGSNTTFTLSKAPETGSLKVYRGGARQRVTEDYTFSTKTITFTIAPVVGEILLCDYRY